MSTEYVSVTRDELLGLRTAIELLIPDKGVFSRTVMTQWLGTLDSMLSRATPSAPRVVSDEDVDQVAKIIADHIGHGMREKCYDVARSAIESLPAVRAPDGWDKGRYSYTQLFNAIGAAVEWREHKTLGISVAKFEEAMLAATPNPSDTKEEG